MSGSNSTIYNYCPHDIVIYDKDGKNAIVTFTKANGPPLRLKEVVDMNIKMSPLRDGNVPVGAAPTYSGLSHEIPKEHTHIIVSQIVAEYIKKNHNDVAVHVERVYAPATGPAQSVRNDKGEIVGTKQLIKYV